MHGDGLSLHPATAVMSVLLLYLQHYSNSFFFAYCLCVLRPLQHPRHPPRPRPPVFCDF